MIERPPASPSRRRLLRHVGVVAAAAVAAPARARAAAPGQILLGAGKHRYRWVKDWAQLPAGTGFGNTHGCIVVDAKKRVYVNTDTESAVMVFDPQGKLLTSWGQEFKGGSHGMTLFREKGQELMYLAHTGRHEVVKCTLDGKVLRTFSFPEKAGVYRDASEYKPTSVAVAPSGDFYVGDGYGLSWVHHYRADGEYVRSWGGKGSEPGKLHTPHGVWVDTRGKTPAVLVADRSNSRLQIFSLEGELRGVVGGIFERPCHVHQRGPDLVVPDLNGRVTILDRDNKLVAHLGENTDPEQRGKNPVPPQKWRDGLFLAPHCARWDAEGNLYVMDWNKFGRITKLERVKA